MTDDQHDDERPLPASLDPRRGPSRSARRRQTTTWVKVLRSFAAVLSVVVLAGTAYGTAMVNRMNSASGTLTDTESEENTNRLGNDEDINILVVGNDSRTGYSQEDLEKIGASDEGSMATDTIMLIHAPANGEKVTVVSFPRDSYVAIPGFGSNKLNSAFVNGYFTAPDTASDEQRQAVGQQTLIDTISQLSGLKIDHYVEVTLLGFYDLTNALGGIEVNLCAPAKDPTGNSGADFPAGKQVLDGSQALSFVRQRYGLPDGDLDRIKRQQYFFGAVIRKVLDQGMLDLVNVGKLSDTIDALAGTIRYDQNLDPLELADQMSNIAAGNVEFKTIPLAEQWDDNIDGMSVVVLADQDELDDFFSNLSASGSEPAAPSSEAPQTVEPDEVTLDVYNGSGVQGVATTAAEELDALGFEVQNVLTAATSDWATSVVQYPPGMESEAATVAAAVPGATIEESDDLEKVILIIGANYPGLPGADDQTPTTPSTEPETPQTGGSTAADEGCIY